MPVYAYRGVSTAGKKRRGHVDAESPRAARAQLKRDGIFVTDFEESSAEALTKARSGSRFNVEINLAVLQRISPMDVSLMTRQAATLIGAGIPLVEALRAPSMRSVRMPFSMATSRMTLAPTRWMILSRTSSPTVRTS